MRSLALKIPPVVVVLALAGLMWAAARLVPALTVPMPAHRVLAAVLAATGAAIALAGVASFRRAKTTVNPLAPAAVSALVVSGVYRRTRNPMYLGMLMIQLGYALWEASMGVLAFVPFAFIAIDRAVIAKEESYLRRKFGKAFEDYCARVRRWI